MSDYSFLKSGGSTLVEPMKMTDKEIENIELILGLFVSNSIKTAAQYVEYCGRNGITKEDIRYSLRFEVFEFLKRPDFLEGIEEIKQEMLNEDDEDGDESDENDNSMIIPEDELHSFERISQDKLNTLNTQNREFIDKLHSYSNDWDQWTPVTPLEKILKNAIDKIG